MYEKMTERLQEEKFCIYGLEIRRNGEKIFSWHPAPDIRYPIYSATKSVTSLAVGFAVSEGRFSVDLPLSVYLPQEYLSRMQPEKRAAFVPLSVRRFLTMSVPGYPFRPEGEDWLDFSLGCAIDAGKNEFAYSNIPAYLVGLAVEQAVGEKMENYLEPRLFQPLGIEQPVLRTDPQGRFYGATGMELTIEELSRIGEVYLTGGCYRGKRLLPESWIKAAASRQIINREGGYGYFVWVQQNNFSISGKWGQKCILYPERNLSVSWLGNMPADSGKMERLVRGFLEGSDDLWKTAGCIGEYNRD